MGENAFIAFTVVMFSDIAGKRARRGVAAGIIFILLTVFRLRKLDGGCDPAPLFDIVTQSASACF